MRASMPDRCPGSSPVEGALENDDTVRKSVKRRNSNLRDCLWVRLPPVSLRSSDMRRLGIGEPHCL
jgi:hypothetical protein